MRALSQLMRWESGCFGKSETVPWCMRAGLCWTWPRSSLSSMPPSLGNVYSHFLFCSICIHKLFSNSNTVRSRISHRLTCILARSKCHVPSKRCYRRTRPKRLEAQSWRTVRHIQSPSKGCDATQVQGRGRVFRPEHRRQGFPEREGTPMAGRPSPHRDQQVLQWMREARVASSSMCPLHRVTEERVGLIRRVREWQCHRDRNRGRTVKSESHPRGPLC